MPTMTLPSLRLDEYLTRLTALGFSGGIIAARDGEVVLCKGYGLAQREGGLPFTPDTIFPNGSITKPFTSTAAVQLILAGKLSPDDLLSDHFDGVPADKADIRVHQLLTHTDGFPGALGFDFDLIDRDELLAQALACELEFEPGSAYSYSNVGFSLVAMIVEDVSGQMYADYVDEHVLAPAGMTTSGYRLQQWPEQSFAHGYLGGEAFGSMRDRPWTPDGPSWHLRGNGGLHTTLRDMYRFHLALLDDTLLSADGKALAFAPHADEGGGESFYGYGWVTQQTRRGTTCLWHDGGNPYFSSDLRRFVDEDAVYFIHSNTGDMKAPRLTDTIERLLFDEPVELPPAVVDLGDELDALAGTWSLPSGATLDVDVTGGHLSVTASGQAAFALLRGDASGESEAREAITRRTGTILESALVQGDFAPLAEAMGGKLGADDLQRALGPHIAEIVDEFGAIQAVQALGTVRTPRRRSLSSWAALRCEQGAPSFVLMWDGDSVAGIDRQPAVEPLRFYPVGGTRLTSFELGNPDQDTLTIERDAAGRPVALALVVRTGTGRAVRP